MASGESMKFKNRIAAIILLSIFMIGLDFAQTENENKIELTGSLYADSKIIQDSYYELNSNPLADDMPSKKSPVLAGVLSALIPGAGQVYNEDYWIAAAFVAVEAALVTTAIVYENKGDDQTEYFENYADDYTNPEHNWSVVKYAEWLNNYHEGNIEINPDETLPPWERVDWNQLNEAEIGSHHLAPYGDQQYYEMIGKYHQFAAGWNDFDPAQSSTDPISSNFLYYSDLRGQANDYYNTSSTAIVGIYINHLLAAAEAVWGATRFNQNLAINLRVEPYNFASGTELVPTIKMKFSF